MPPYEMSLIVKALQRPELIQALKRSCEAVLTRGGVIRKMENLGHRNLPYRMTAHGKKYTVGNYFLVHLDAPTNILPDVKDELQRDLDILRHSCVRSDYTFPRPCLKGPCTFGELPNPDHERRVWKMKVQKKLHLTKHDERKAREKSSA